MFVASCETQQENLMASAFLTLLKLSDFGEFLKNCVGHLEYFFSTMNFEQKSKFENPFKKPENYPAFDFKEGEECLVEMIDNEEVYTPKSAAKAF